MCGSSWSCQLFENAFYIIALIFEHFHLRVKNFCLPDDRKKKLIVTIAFLIGKTVFLIPEIIIAEIAQFLWIHFQ